MVPGRPDRRSIGQSTHAQAEAVVAQPAITACSWSVVTLFPLPAVNARDVRCGGIIGPYTARLHTLHGSALAWQVDGPRAYKYVHCSHRPLDRGASADPWLTWVGRSLVTCT